MPPLAINVARVEMVYKQDNQIVENVWYRSGAEDDIASLTDIATYTMTQWRNWVMPITSELVDLVFCRATHIGVLNGNSVEIPAPPDSNGQETSPALPNHVTAAIKLVTGLGGRHRRGRKYHVGLCENQVERSSLMTGFRQTLQDAYSQWIQEALGSPYPFVIASFILNGVPRPAALVTTVIDCITEPTIDSMRRRLPGRGT